jgi:hypothetical protein
MEIIVKQETGKAVPVTIFQITGDLITEDELVNQARTAYANGSRNLLIDLKAVPYVSSVGLRALHEIFDMLRTSSPAESDAAIHKGIIDGTFKSPHLKLLHPNKKVLEILKVTGYDMFLDIFHDYSHAIASYQSSG